ncbi:unnamed protein product [Protopolystoma xenopodis]|uniref:Uncharacterized protein n=1 Tax=Protopolystoma xenopodis TaxID=117903 RepID=A0A3S5B6U6_9PLAT|nr:unnamed protein product [Protopolystoma xenopodis]
MWPEETANRIIPEPASRVDTCQSWRGKRFFVWHVWTWIQSLCPPAASDGDTAKFELKNTPFRLAESEVRPTFATFPTPRHTALCAQTASLSVSRTTNLSYRHDWMGRPTFAITDWHLIPLSSEGKFPPLHSQTLLTLAPNHLGQFTLP